VLLSALEEKLLVLPPNQNRAEYIRVSPHFRAIFTSNPEEYCGVHGTQDALQDRLITINMPEPDELAQQQILSQKVGIDSVSACQIVQLVRAYQANKDPDMASSLRPSLMIATICHDHGIPALAENAEFRDVCSDILLTRAKEDIPAATRRLWDLFNQFIGSQTALVAQLSQPTHRPTARLHGEDDEALPIAAILEPTASEPATEEPSLTAIAVNPAAGPGDSEDSEDSTNLASPPTAVLSETRDGDEADANVPTVDAVVEDAMVTASTTAGTTPIPDADALETRIFDFLDTHGATRLVALETALELNRFQVVNTLKSLLDQGLVKKQDNGTQPAVYSLSADEED